jgi:putative transposase
MSIRKLIFTNDQIYHIYNRGIEKRTIFESKSDYQHALTTFCYYQRSNLPLRLSHFLSLNQEERDKFDPKKYPKLVDIISFCLMPNHFHLLVKQLVDNGVKTFISNFSNSYSRYFNLKHNRSGHLLQGTFKAVWVEDDGQLMRVSHYIHLNPVASFLIKEGEIFSFQWSSASEYISKNNNGICNKKLILDYYKNVDEYKKSLIFQAEKLREIQESDKLLIDK